MKVLGSTVETIGLGEYMRAVRDWPQPTGRKTFTWDIYDRHDGLLGEVKWHGAWRQYTFWPEKECIFNAGCLSELVAFLKKQNAEHKEARRGS